MTHPVVLFLGLLVGVICVAFIGDIVSFTISSLFVVTGFVGEGFCSSCMRHIPIPRLVNVSTWSVSIS